VFYVEKTLGFRIFLLYAGYDFQSYNASRMEFFKMNSTKFETFQKPLCQIPFLTQMLLPSVLQKEFLEWQKNPYSFLLIIELYSKYFTLESLLTKFPAEMGQKNDHNNSSWYGEGKLIHLKMNRKHLLQSRRGQLCLKFSCKFKNSYN